MKNDVSKFLVTITAIASLGVTILSTIIYVYTIYYYAVNNGFGGAFLSIITPVISSCFLFFELLSIDGFFNTFTYLILAFLFCIAAISICAFLASLSSSNENDY